MIVKALTAQPLSITGNIAAIALFHIFFDVRTFFTHTIISGHLINLPIANSDPSFLRKSRHGGIENNGFRIGPALAPRIKSGAVSDRGSRMQNCKAIIIAVH
jgi:hypothetical protein